jgi:tetratricopeptide (TPR) repeat protein
MVLLIGKRGRSTDAPTGAAVRCVHNLARSTFAAERACYTATDMEEVRSRCTACWIALLCLGSAQSHAQDLHEQPASYESIIDEGVREFDAGNYPEAHSLFEQAHALQPNARTLRALGFCAFELKHYVESAGDLEAALVDTRNPLTAEQRSEAATTLSRALRYIGELLLETQPRDAQVVIDGRAVSERRFKLDAGEHNVVASEPGYQSRDLTLTIVGAQQLHAQLVLPALAVSPAQVAGAAPLTSAAPNAGLEDDRQPGIAERWWFWTAIGALVVGGTVTALLIAQSHGEKTDAGSSGITLHSP